MINKHKSVNISYEKLKELYKTKDHNETVEIIKNLISQNELEPVKNSKPTPYYPQVYSKYRIVRGVSKEDLELLEELNYKLHNRFNIDYYRKNLKSYVSVREYVLALNYYLVNNEDKLDKKISINERSYEIFKKEKFLADKIGAATIKNLGLDLEKDLNVYRTAEPFIYLSNIRNYPQNILIIENKDTYITVFKMLMDNKQILGQDIQTIIYGEGRKIIKSIESMYYDNTLSYLNNPKNKFLYWGDIDKTGFNIFSSLKKRVEFTELTLLERAYIKMIEKTKDIDLNYIPKEQRDSYAEGISYIKNDKLRENIKDILGKNKYIPQEALNMFNLED